MLKELYIRDYRSCLDTKFALNPQLSVLIGPNGSGKTNILNAMLLLHSLTEEFRLGRYGNEELPTSECKVRARFDIEGKTATLNATIPTFTDEANHDIVIGATERWYLKDFTGKSRRPSIPLWYARSMLRGSRVSATRARMYHYSRYRIPDTDGSTLKPICTVADFLSSMSYYSASQFTNPSRCPVSFEIETEGESSRGVRLDGHAKFLFDLYTEFKSDSKVYQQFFEIVGPSGIGLVDCIDFKEVLTSSIDYSVKSGGRLQERTRDKVLVIPQFTIGKSELSPNQLSEGTFKTITLLFYIVTESRDILLIEEPEVCVHHGLLASIVELIKIYSREKQIVISTYSDFVLDQVEPDNVFVVFRDSEDGTKVHHIPSAMSSKELRALRTYLSSEGNLGEYWRLGALEE